MSNWGTCAALVFVQSAVWQRSCYKHTFCQDIPQCLKLESVSVAACKNVCNFVPDKVQEWCIPLIQGRRNKNICTCCNTAVDTTWVPWRNQNFLCRLRWGALCLYKDIGERILAGLLRRLWPKDVPRPNQETPPTTIKKSTKGRSIITPDVLCPCGCTEFLHQAHACRLPFSIFIQHHLHNVTLNMSAANYYNKLHLVETSYLDSLCTKNEPYPNTLMWNTYLIDCWH